MLVVGVLAFESGEHLPFSQSPRANRSGSTEGGAFWRAYLDTPSRAMIKLWDMPCVTGEHPAICHQRCLTNEYRGKEGECCTLRNYI
jgi:hypothetical protein